MKRQYFYQQIKEAFKIHPIVAILGARQVGKTTLARYFISTLKKPLPSINYFDLENLEDMARLEQPQFALSQLRGLIVIDEIQRKPDLFRTLRVLADDPLIKRQFLILGSAAGELLRQSSESLAGRIQYIELPPFSIIETHEIQNLWVRGGFPPSYLAISDTLSFMWREAYIRTFLEQDIPNLGIRIAPLNLRRYWMMLTHYHGNICNMSEIGRALGLSDKTIHGYLDILTATFMLRQLPPWFENISKRQVKRPKIYFRDSGLYHALLDIPDYEKLLLSKNLGASWEGFVLEELIRFHGALPSQCFFWSTQSRAELDLLIVKGQEKIAFEIKYTDSPRITKSMSIAITDLKLEKLTLIYPGQKSYYLDEKIFVTNLKDYILKSNNKTVLD